MKGGVISTASFPVTVHPSQTGFTHFTFTTLHARAFSEISRRGQN